MRTLLSLLLVLSFGSPHTVRAAGAIPSLCKPAEVVLANARLLRVDRASSNGTPREKTVSLCADRENEPIGRLVYRFGTLSVTEAEIVASRQQKAGIFIQSDEGAHIGVIGIVFYAKSYSYVVSEGVGMANGGLRLSVYKSTRRVAEFSSLEYESNIGSITTDVPRSPVFKRIRPIEPL